MTDTDIDSLDFPAAREYVLNYIIGLKRTQKDRAMAEEELAQWERRVKLAAARGEPILKRSAEQRVAELKSRRQRLREEEGQLQVKVDVLKEKLRAVALRSSLSVDTDALLAQLSMVAGSRDPLTEQLAGEEATQTLEELKRRMREEGK